MNQPQNPAGAPPPPPHFSAAGDPKPPNPRRNPPNPEDIISFYESKGLDRQSASLKALQHLHSLLLNGGAATPPAADIRRKLDNAVARLAVLDMKLDAKPGYPESVAVGVASGAILRAIPHAMRAIGDAWGFVAAAARGRAPPA